MSHPEVPHASRAAWHRGRRLLAAAAVVAVAGLGSAGGVLLVGHETARIGPVEVDLALHPSRSGGARLQVPPLGAMGFATHAGPLTLAASVVELRPEVAKALAQDPAGFRTLGNRVGDDLRSALVGLVLRAAVGALLLTGLLALVVFRSGRAVGLCLSVVVAGGLGTAVVTGLTFRSESLQEPTYTGLLASAPTAIGDAQTIVANFSAYRQSLAQLVGNVVDLYDVTSSLPTYRPGRSTVAVLHVSDLHLNPAGVDLIRSLVDKFQVRAVLDTGDLTDHGSAAEIPFEKSLAGVRVPYVFIRGNHDSAATVAALRQVPNVQVLDDAVTEVAGIRVAGIADPRFTPDKNTRETPDDAVLRTGEQLARTIAAQPAFVTVAMVHDPLSAPPLHGLVPLVLAGHKHKRSTTVQDKTLVLVQGSTGGAGLRGLEGEQPTPLACSVLYFDTESHRLQAWDEITVGGLGTTSITVERHLRPADADFAGPTLAPRAAPPWGRAR